MRFIAIVLWLSFCAFGEAPPRNASTHKRPAAAAPKLTDAQILQTMQAKYAKSKMAQKGFKFSVSGGVATIEGKASVIQHKGAMTRMARLAGATRVVNNIEISEEAKAKARDKLASGRRRPQVKRSEPRSQTR